MIRRFGKHLELGSSASNESCYDSFLFVVFFKYKALNLVAIRHLSHAMIRQFWKNLELGGFSSSESCYDSFFFQP